MLQSESSKKSICMTHKTEKEVVGGFFGRGMMVVVEGSAPPPLLHSACCHAGRWSIIRRR